jgi:hypothetical protein
VQLRQVLGQGAEFVPVIFRPMMNFTTIERDFHNLAMGPEVRVHIRKK